ncbi:MAG: TonB-dependent receptor [Pseudomonadota bacterium]
MAALLLALPATASAGEDPAGIPLQGVPDEQDLSRLSLEDLAQVEVTSVSRRPQALADAAAAIYVISSEDIRRSGATSLPEVLRLAPNLNVQRVNSVEYAISARGFNGYEQSNKLLVLIDGRAIYSTLASGVFWDAHDLVLEDIERIEIISGPGGALYGSNAMNGVINIITRPATETGGGLIRLTAGEEDNSFALRYGGSMGGDGAWQAHLLGYARDDSLRPDGSDATDGSDGLRGGARADWRLGDNRLTVQGEMFDNTVAINEDYSGTDTSVRGGHALGRLTRPLWDGELQVQAYYDRFTRDEGSTLEQTRTWDLFVQHDVLRGRHHFVWGGGYRSVDSAFTPAPGGAFLDPPKLTLTLANLFAQDQITLSEGLTLTLGVKYEDNSFSGDELLPSVRLAWARSGGDLLWGAVSRASRTPNRIERGLTLPGFLEAGTFQSERLTAWEAGYRANPWPDASFSISAFYNVYDDLRTVAITPGTFVPFRLANFGSGETWGVEAWGSYDVSARWRLSLGVTTLEKDFDTNPIEEDITGLVSTGQDPDYQVLLRSQSDLTDRLELDVRLRAVGELVTTDSYVEADVRLGWRLTDRLELSLNGQNLLNDMKFETDDPGRRRAFGRSLFASLRASF